MANNVHAHRSVIFYLLSVFPSHLRLLNGQAKVRYCHNAVGCEGKYLQAIPMYIQTIGTRDRARHVASRRICPHIHVLCMPACLPMSARPRLGSPHDDLHRSSLIGWRAQPMARFYGRCTYRNVLRISKSANAGRPAIIRPGGKNWPTYFHTCSEFSFVFFSVVRSWIQSVLQPMCNP